MMLGKEPVSLSSGTYAELHGVRRGGHPNRMGSIAHGIYKACVRRADKKRQSALAPSENNAYVRTSSTSFNSLILHKVPCAV
jgi:hypothetical protein